MDPANRTAFADKKTEKSGQFDQTVSAGAPYGATVILDSHPGATLILEPGPLPSEIGGFGESSLPFGESALPFGESDLPFGTGASRPEREAVPERLREMKRLYEYGRESTEARAKNFVRQARFMEDYEDDQPWQGDFLRYFPTYHDLSTRQLRGYFTWRARLRRGDWSAIPASAAYLYLYELLNGIGTASPEDALEKMRAFEAGFLDSGIGDPRMRPNLRRWMLEYAVIHDLPPELARQVADPELLEADRALAALENPEEKEEEEVFRALCLFGGKKPEDSPVLTADPERGRRLFCAAWKSALAYQREGIGLFTLCFGERRLHPWYPLSNALVTGYAQPGDRDYALDENRVYRRRHGVWQVEAYEKLSFDRERFLGFLHETDARLRRYLKTGRYLRESLFDEWAVPYIDDVIAAEEKARLEAARPKITIDFSGLERIRRDAGITRESLLTGEERVGSEESAAEETISAAGSGEAPAEETPAFVAGETLTAEKSPAAGVAEAPAAVAPAAKAPEAPVPEAEVPPPDLPLDALQLQVLRTLLSGGDPAELLRARRVMPSILADAVNDALFDEIGDTVLLCEDDRLSLVEEYAEDLRELLG